MTFVVNLLIGLLFGAGLVVSGMTNPAKVQNFLDLAGNWDPSLAFVMGGAVIVAMAGFRLVLRRPKPIADVQFHVPASVTIDAPLLVGPAIFGIGWGLSGYCPGPAIAALGLGAPGTVVYVVGMLAGMQAARLLPRGPVLIEAD